jgi:putative FmdB family regulatory protein
MPIYEYRCQDCNTKFEKLLRRAADSAQLVCPSCGHSRLTLQLSVFAAHTASSAEAAPAPCCPNSDTCPDASLCGMH